MTTVPSNQQFEAPLCALDHSGADRQPLIMFLPDSSRSTDRVPLRITRIGHATVLIQWGDEALLTDPWFSEKPLYHPGERFGMRIEELPNLTVVLTSMNHYDHFDVAAFAVYRDHDVPFVVIAASAQKAAAAQVGFRNIRELSDGETTKIGSFSIHAISANRAKPTDFVYEQAYVIEVGGRIILFAPHFPKDLALKEVARRFPRVDLALLGVNGLRVKPMGWRQLSMDPADAARVCARMNVRIALPIHYAFNGGWFSTTFLLQHKGTPEQFSEAVRDLAPNTIPLTLAPGQPLYLAPC